MPATLKIKEKPRKYHFSLSQSTFTPRNNSTCSLHSQALGAPGLDFETWETAKFTRPRILNRNRFSRLQPAQVPIEDDPRNKHCRKQVGQQAEGEGRRE